MRFQTDPSSARDSDRDADADPLDTHPDNAIRQRTDDDRPGDEAAGTDTGTADASTADADRDGDGVPDDEEEDDTFEPVDRDRDGVPDEEEDMDAPGDPPVDPPPAPTAFGASTVGGAVAASALAGRDRTDDRDPGQRDPDHRDPGQRDPVLAADPDPVAADGPDGRVAPAGDDHAVGVATPPPGAAVDPGTAGAPVGATVPVGAGVPEGRRAVPVEDEASAVRVQAADRDGDGTPDADEPDGGGDLVAWPPDPVTEPAGPAAAATPASLWEDGATVALRERWRDVQLRFVDDPRGAADEAQALVSEAVEALTAALAERRSDLDGWRTGDGDAGRNDTETERLRVAVRGYRDFLDRLLGL